MTFFNKIDSGSYAPLDVPELDLYQNKFIEIGNNFIELYNDRLHKLLFEKTLNFFCDYAKQSFAAEENLMREYSYPHIGVHSAKHKEYITKVAALYKIFLTNKDTKDDKVSDKLGQDICLLIMDWFEFHILYDDRRLADFLVYEHHINKQEQ